ncbi:MAG TPA: lysophospholipid acyltransferase family protein [Rhizomicrobium sp.]|jgi:1-acyl-sn-glycerol-3-phosphate acyltransferase
MFATIFRSALYFIWFALVSAVLNVGCLPLLLFPRRVTMWAPKAWCAALLWGLKWIAGLDYEVRGQVPADGVIVASKHMSMWDTIALYHTLHDSVFVVKKQLMSVPLYGWYARKVEMIPIDREAGASALRSMAAEARAALARGRAIVIFPEGTRKKPDAPPDYKPGVAALYGQLAVPCVPVALNSGLFWTGPAGFLKKRGTIVLEYLDPIPAGLNRAEFMRILEERIESTTAKLVSEGNARLSQVRLR